MEVEVQGTGGMGEEQPKPRTMKRAYRDAIFCKLTSKNLFKGV